MGDTRSLDYSSFRVERFRVQSLGPSQRYLGVSQAIISDCQKMMGSV